MDDLDLGASEEEKSARKWSPSGRHRGSAQWKREQVRMWEQIVADFQRSYDTAVGRGGTVINVWAAMGRMGGLAIWVLVREPDDTQWFYSPFLDSEPSTEDVEAVDEDSVAWLHMMLGATDWAEWEWDRQEYIPDY
jgi:hypothetical protein